MTDHLDPGEREVLREEDELVAGLLGDYAVRRDDITDTRLPDLLACAAEFGDAAKLKLIALVALYEALRLSADT